MAEGKRVERRMKAKNQTCLEFHFVTSSVSASRKAERLIAERSYVHGQ